MQVFNPLGSSVPPPPLVPSDLASSSGMNAIIPGPFILLLLLPSLPLLLFTIGARPPDTSALPFSLMEVFTTAAFVSVAGGVLLAMVIWPDVGRQVGEWIGAGGASEAGSVAQGGWTQWWRGGTGGMSQTANPASGTGTQYQTGQIGSAAMSYTRKIPKTQAGRAAARVYAQRKALINLYDPSKPYVPTALFVTGLLLAILVVSVGNLLRKMYELDGPAASSSSSSDRPSSSRPSEAGTASPWVMAEIKKRQTELAKGKTREQTLERFKKEAEAEREMMKSKLEKMGPEAGAEYRTKKEKERAGDLKVLKGQLQKLRLTTVGTDGEEKVNAKTAEVISGPDKGKGGEPEGAEDSMKEDSSTVQVDRKAPKWPFWQRDRAARPPQDRPGNSTPLSERLKRVVLPIPLKHAVPPGQGRTWEMTSDPQVLAASAQSAGNAENLAAKMRA